MLKTKTNIELIVEQTGLIASDQISIHIEEAQKQQLPIPAYLAKQFEIQENDLLMKIADVMQLPYERLNDKDIDSGILDQIPTKAIFQFNVIPIYQKQDKFIS